MFNQYAVPKFGDEIVLSASAGPQSDLQALLGTDRVALSHDLEESSTVPGSFNHSGYLFNQSWEASRDPLDHLDTQNRSLPTTDFVLGSGSSSNPGFEDSVRHRRHRRKTRGSTQTRARALEKNRKAAARCRQKQREYELGLQECAKKEERKKMKLMMQVAELRDSILSMKESIIFHSDCGDRRIKEYLVQHLARTTDRCRRTCPPV